MLLDYRHGCEPYPVNDAMLGSVSYGLAEPGSWAGLSVPMAVLPAGGVEYTAWISSLPCQEGIFEGLAYRHNTQLLFGMLTLGENEFPGSAGQSGLQLASRCAYDRIFASMRRLGFSNLVRCWNYLPGINLHGGSLERYRQFNIGRQDAFIAAQRSHLEESPAACALGTSSGDLVVYFLAAQAKPVNVENPRQVSAWRYPERYGPRSPTFSRASLLALGDDEALLISGTASIVGHESCHLGDVGAQTEESLLNIEAVLEQANRSSALGGYTLDTLELKVFVRNPLDYPRVEAAIHKKTGGACRVIYLHADICRAELLVEIEALGLRRAA